MGYLLRRELGLAAQLHATGNRRRPARFWVVSLSCCDGTAYGGLEAAPAIFETAVHARRVP